VFSSLLGRYFCRKALVYFHKTDTDFSAAVG
jgi:hypothetical protein